MWQFAQGRRRHRRGLPRARRSDHRRQRQPLQRDRRPRDLSDAGHRRRRPARGRRPRARAGASRRAGDVVVLLGEGRGELGGSEYLKVVHGRGARRAAGARPRRASARCRRCSSTLADARLIRSAHDCSDGGLAVTLAECCFDTGGIGAEVSIDARRTCRRRGAERRGGALRRVGVARRRVGGAASDCRRCWQRRGGARACRRASIGRTGGDRIRIAVGRPVGRSTCRWPTPSRSGRTATRAVLRVGRAVCSRRRP